MMLSPFINLKMLFSTLKLWRLVIRFHILLFTYMVVNFKLWYIVVNLKLWRLISPFSRLV